MYVAIYCKLLKRAKLLYLWAVAAPGFKSDEGGEEKTFFKAAKAFSPKMVHMGIFSGKKI